MSPLIPSFVWLVFEAKLLPKCNLGFSCQCTWVKPLCKSIIIAKEAPQIYRTLVDINSRSCYVTFGNRYFSTAMMAASGTAKVSCSKTFLVDSVCLMSPVLLCLFPGPCGPDLLPVVSRFVFSFHINSVFSFFYCSHVQIWDIDTWQYS